MGDREDDKDDDARLVACNRRRPGSSTWTLDGGQSQDQLGRAAAAAAALAGKDGGEAIDAPRPTVAGPQAASHPSIPVNGRTHDRETSGKYTQTTLEALAHPPPSSPTPPHLAPQRDNQDMGRKAEVQRIQLEKLMGPEGEYRAVTNAGEHGIVYLLTTNRYISQPWASPRSNFISQTPKSAATSSVVHVPMISSATQRSTSARVPSPTPPD